MDPVMYKIKYITKTQTPNNKNNIILVEESLEELEDKVILNSSYYEKLFNKKLSDSNYKPWKRKIVKIQNGGIVVYRMFKGHGLYSITNNEIGLTWSSINILANDKKSESEITLPIKLSVGSKCLFYWQHPQHSVRVAYKLGILSFAIGILSLILTLIN